MNLGRPALLAVSGMALLSCGTTTHMRPSGPPRHAPSATEPDTKVTTVFEKDYGKRGRLVARMEEKRQVAGRLVGFSFQMEPPGAKPLPEMPGLGFYDPTPFGSGEPLTSVLDAELTSDPALVVIYFDKIPSGESIGYSGSVFSEEGSEAVVPLTGYESVFYSADPIQPRRRASVTGSLKAGNLTVALKGPRDTLRFRFEFFDKGRFGWYALPGQAQPPGTYYMAPSLPTTAPAKPQ